MGNPAPEQVRKRAEQETQEPLPPCSLSSVLAHTRRGPMVALLPTATMEMVKLVSSPRGLGRTGEALCQLQPLRQLGLLGTIWVDVLTVSKSAQGLWHGDHKLPFLPKKGSP